MSHRYALSFLKIKASTCNHYLIGDEKIEDLAWDFIAELFQKDKQGNLVVLQRYFNDINLPALSEPDVKIELRKLVFTKVDDNLYRYYGEKDPSLKKIIRNIKLAVRDRNCASGVCYRDGFLVVDEDRPGISAVMPADIMQIRLCTRLKKEMQIPAIIVEVIDIITEQEAYRKRFPLVVLASIIRESFVILHDDPHPENTAPDAESDLLKKELDQCIEESVSRIRKEVTGFVICNLSHCA